MKKLFTLIAIHLCWAPAIMAQEGEQVEKTIIETKPNWMVKTPPLRSLITNVDMSGYELKTSNDMEERKKREWVATAEDIGIPENNGIDPVLQDKMGDKKGDHLVKANWQGSGSQGIPMDPTGAAGIDHYMQATNSYYRIWNKDGTPETGAIWLHAIWPSGDTDGDPIVMYDRYADRWFISQFQYATNGMGQVVPPYSMQIAVSETSDPLGSYYTYEYSFSSFPDYPKFGVWSNCYLLTINSNSFDCILFERDKMLTGDPSANMVSMYFPNLNVQFNSMCPAYAEGVWAPEADAPTWAFAVQDNFMSGISTDHIEILKIDVDWNNTANCNVTTHQNLNTAPFNGYFSPNWQDLDQPGTTNNLDAIAGIFMYKASYRRFDGYDVMLLCHTVDINNTNRAGVRWYELRMDAGTDQWYIHQQSTYDPADNRHRWMANLAMDVNGNIGMAYSCMGDGSGDYAGLRFTGRFATDPLDEMTVIEQIAVEGAGFQDPSWTSDPLQKARYGDYSHMTIDPTDDATFWFTGEYLGNGGGARTRVFSFAMWELLGEEETPISEPYFNSFQPNPNQMTVMWRDLRDDQFDITILDMNGKLVAKEASVDASMEQITFDIPSGATGIYLVNLTGENTQMSEKIWFAK